MNIRCLIAKAVRTSLVGCCGLGLLAGCGNENNYVVREQIDSFVQTPTDQVDILFVVDDSQSMENEQRSLARAFGSFARQLVDEAVDFHIGVVPTSQPTGVFTAAALVGDPPFLSGDHEDLIGAFETRTRLGIGGSDKEKGLQAAAAALDEGIGNMHNLGFARPAANTLVIAVSDEDDCSDYGDMDGLPASACYEENALEWGLKPVDRLVERLQRTKTDPTQVAFSAIISPPHDPCGGNTAPGRRYQEAADLTGGTVHRICQSDWSDILDALGLRALGIITEFRLQQGAVPETIQVFIDQVEISTGAVNGWTYDPERWLVQFHGDAIPARGAFVSITYEVSLFADAPVEDTGLD